MTTDQLELSSEQEKLACCSLCCTRKQAEGDRFQMSQDQVEHIALPMHSTMKLSQDQCVTLCKGGGEVAMLR